MRRIDKQVSDESQQKSWNQIKFNFKYARWTQEQKQAHISSFIKELYRDVDITSLIYKENPSIKILGKQKIV